MGGRVAEITVRRRGELTRGVFGVLLDHPEGLAAKEVLARLRETVPPTPFEASEYSNLPGVERYGKIVRFGTIAPVKAGWLVKSRGIWTLTEAGIEAYNRITDPEEFTQALRAAYRQWRRNSTEPDEEGDGEAEEPTAGVTLEEAEEAALEQIRAHIAQISPYDFQDLIAGLIEATGYHVSWVAPPGPDRGVDIVASGDQLGIAEPRVKVQVKHRASTADVSDLRSFWAVLGTNDVGIFVSTGGFTRDAQFEARGHETRRLTLLDLDRVLELWIANYDKIDERRRALLPLRPIHFLAIA